MEVTLDLNVSCWLTDTQFNKIYNIYFNHDSFFLFLMFVFIYHCQFLLFFQVKSFIETQKALLAEIQNGCRRNFILAKEKEERLQQSASMTEIASAAEEEDSNTAPEENSLPLEESSTAPEDTKPNNSSEQDGEEITPDPDPQRPDSDSDTEDEVEEEKPIAETKPVVNSVQNPPGQVAVSSPGRGHKIFLVTRVENPNTTGGGLRSQDGKDSPLAVVKSPGGPSLANGLEAELGRMASSCDSKGMHKVCHIYLF